MSGYPRLVRGTLSNSALPAAPKPPSLKEQALQALYRFDDTQGHEGLTPEQIADDFVLIRRALESLPD